MHIQSDSISVGRVRRGLSLVWTLRAAVVVLATSGCVVPAARYEEARSVIQVEQEAHRRTMDTLRDVSDRLARAEEALRQREAQLAERAQKISEAELQSSIAEHEKTEANDLVDQLRGELGRVGDHLRAFADDKKRLSAALDGAEARLAKVAQRERELAENAEIVRDLSLLLHERVKSGEVELAMLDGRAVLRVPSAAFTSESPGALGKEVVAAVARVLTLHPTANAELSSEQPAAAANAAAAASPSPAERVKVALSAAGAAAERVSISQVADESLEPDMVEVSLGVRPTS